jgi:hypothetical protein
MKYRNLVLVMSLVLFGYSTVTFFYTAANGPRLQTTPSRAVDDQVVQYNMAVRAGSKTDQCIQAGFVASAYIQVKDEPNYQAWTGIRNNDCAAAGLPK